MLSTYASDIRLPDEVLTRFLARTARLRIPTNEKKRFHVYGLISLYCGFREQVIIPNKFVSRIRRKFPDPNNNYSDNRQVWFN